jgi:hypothetical protein
MPRLLRLCLTVVLLNIPILPILLHAQEAEKPEKAMQTEPTQKVEQKAEKPVKFSFHSGVYASYGDYGVNAHITYIYFPLTLKYYATPRLTVALTLPFLYQKNGTAATVEGQPVGVGPAVGQQRRGPTFGLGDIYASANYIFVEEKPNFPALSVYGALKFPTADPNQALGTGEFDVGGGLALRKFFNKNLVYGYAGYTYLGKPPGVSLLNYFSYGVGLARWFTPSFKPYIELNGATRVAPNAKEILSVSGGLEYFFAYRKSVTAYVLKGIIAGAPDYGGGVAFNFYF